MNEPRLDPSLRGGFGTSSRFQDGATRTEGEARAQEADPKGAASPAQAGVQSGIPATAADLALAQARWELDTGEWSQAEARLVALASGAGPVAAAALALLAELALARAEDSNDPSALPGWIARLAAHSFSAAPLLQAVAAGLHELQANHLPTRAERLAELEKAARAIAAALADAPGVDPRLSLIAPGVWARAVDRQISIALERLALSESVEETERALASLAQSLAGLTAPANAPYAIYHLADARISVERERAERTEDAGVQRAARQAMLNAAMDAKPRRRGQRQEDFLETRAPQSAARLAYSRGTTLNHLGRLENAPTRLREAIVALETAARLWGETANGDSTRSEAASARISLARLLISGLARNPPARSLPVNPGAPASQEEAQDLLKQALEALGALLAPHAPRPLSPHNRATSLETRARAREGMAALRREQGNSSAAAAELDLAAADLAEGARIMAAMGDAHFARIFARFAERYAAEAAALRAFNG